MHEMSPSSSINGLVVEYIVAIDVTRVRFPADACRLLGTFQGWVSLLQTDNSHPIHLRFAPQEKSACSSISGLVVEYIVANNVTRVRFLAAA